MSAHKRRSLTLIELMAVAVLVTLITTLATVRLDGLTVSARLHGACRGIGALHARARAEARASGQPRALAFEIGSARMELERPALEDGNWTWRPAHPTDLGAGMTIEALAVRGRTTPEGDRARIRMRGDGRCPDYAVAVRAGSRRAAVFVEGNTGRLRFEDSISNVGQVRDLVEERL